MTIQRYEDMNSMELDIMKEIGSIGTGNAATALSSLLDTRVKMTIPGVSVLGYNDVISAIGDPEDGIAAVLVQMSGEMRGMMLFLLKLDLINAVLSEMMGKTIEDYSELDSLEVSALTEVGNIMMSAYMNALSKLADINIKLSVPAIAVNMLGGVLSVPMTEFGYETDKLLTITGKFIINDVHLDSNLLMLPDIESLNFLMKKLVGDYE